MASSPFSVLCSFCDSEFMAEKDLIEHLMLCGNKTDECPNCNKYVRRAIFAYHYENNCANLDDVPVDDDRQQTPTTNEPLIVVKCDYCRQNYQRKDSEMHKANCLQHQPNRSRNEQMLTDENLPVNSNASSRANDSDGIPCEWCSEIIPFDVYQTHAIACRDREHGRLEKEYQQREEDHRRLEEQSRHPDNKSASKKPGVISTVVSSVRSSASNFLTYVKCKFCGSQREKEGSTFHELHCKMNPRRMGNR